MTSLKCQLTPNGQSLAEPMLTCEICSQEMMLEEDLQTHLLLEHLERDVQCPFCCLRGVSYDETCFHIRSAHPENCQSPRNRPDPSCSTPSLNPVMNIKSNPPGCSWAVAHCGAAGFGMDKDQRGPIPALPETVSRRISPNASTARSHESGRTPSRSWKDEASEQTNSLQNDFHGGGKEFSCPMCAWVCWSASILQEHVELHLDQSPQGVERFECPMCPFFCQDSFSLQNHVELHLDAAADGAESDLKLAKKLQEEELRSREQKAQLEREHFKQLQQQYGLDGSGSYRRQMEATMERAVARGLMAPADFHSRKAEMMESLASGVDDGTTRTQGVVQALYEYYQHEARVQVWLSADTDHYSCSPGDRGWGCGYRNYQMLVSALLTIQPFDRFLSERTIPSIPRVQSMIEEAWKDGVDPQGASHFNHRLQGTRAWIGATEIFSILTCLGLSARIMDFHQPSGPGNTHPRLFDWVKQYFCQSTRGSRESPRVVRTSQPPLYLQHQGHSRTIIGVEQRKSGSLRLLLLDPGSSLLVTRKLLSRDTISTAIHHIRRFSGSFKQQQYQVLATQGILSSEDKQIAILKSRTLTAERIP